MCQVSQLKAEFKNRTTKTMFLLVAVVVFVVASHACHAAFAESIWEQHLTPSVQPHLHNNEGATINHLHHPCISHYTKSHLRISQTTYVRVKIVMNSVQCSGECQTSNQHDQQQEVRKAGRKVDHLSRRGTTLMRVDFEVKIYKNDSCSRSCERISGVILQNKMWSRFCLT